jgi:Protein of unknown function DUF262/Protein of unknown function (DUF1524)
MTAQTLDAKLLQIGSLFDEQDATYTIPIYQRNFAWRVEQIEQLISDIRDAKVDGQGSYFLGNLIVTRRGAERLNYEVVDGQQRLTTLYLILTALRSAGTSVASGYRDRLRYQSRPRSTEALRRLTASLSRQAGMAPETSHEEDQGIHEGFNVVRQFIDQNVGASERAEFAEYLLRNVLVVRAVLPAKTDLNRYFEVMNTRGQQLQQVDIVKARLMSLLGSDDAQQTFAWVWEACADMDSYVQMALTRGDTLLREQLFGTDWAWLNVETFDDLANTHRRRGRGGADDKAFSSDQMDIEGALLKYATIGAPAITDDVENVRFRSTIEFPVFLLHVLKVWHRVDDADDGGLDDKKLIERYASAFDRDSMSSDALRLRVREFTVLMLRCRNIFDSYILKRQFTAATIDEGDWSLQRLIKGKTSPGKTTPSPRYIDLAQSSTTEREEDGGADGATRDLLLIQSMLRVTYTSPRTMHWMTKVLRTVLDAEPMGSLPAERVLGVLRDYARAKVRAELREDGEPRSGFDIARIVFTYVDLLLVSKNPDPEFRFSYRNSIEHFYPRSPDAEQSGDAVSEACLNMFGNLALVSATANSKFNNSLPKAKAENFRTTIEIQSPKLGRMAAITREATWNDAKVREHHEAMVELLREDLGMGREA